MRYKSIADLKDKCGPRAANAAEKALLGIFDEMGVKVVDVTPPKPAKAKARPAKYRNVPCEYDGQRFDSKLECKVYAALVAAYGKDRVIRQVSIPIGAKRVRPDFLIIHETFDDGTFRAELADAKGVLTRDSSAKYNHLEDKHGLQIRLIRK